MTDLDVIERLKNNKSIILSKLDSDIVEYANNRYIDSESLHESIYRIRHNIEIRPTCKVCGGKVYFKNGFKVYCSRSCIHKDPEIKERIKKKIRKTSLQKYGCEHYSSSKQIRDKIIATNMSKYGYACSLSNKEVRNKYKKTMIEKYGSLSYNNIEKHRHTCLIKYGNENFTNRDKYVETCKLKYGVSNTFIVNEYKEKIKKTCKKKYGTEIYVHSKDYKDKCISTCLRKYNVDNPLKSKIIRDKCKAILIRKYNVDNIFKIPELHKQYVDKVRLTCKSKYNVNWISQIPEVKKKIVENGYQTKKNNNSFNKSKIENDITKYLIDNNIEFISQYKSKLYPYCCDFYFPLIELYVEIQGHWTHGGHPYNENNLEDVDKLELWKNKHTKYFDNAINTWTVRDVNKRNTAKQNNLNYIEIFSDKLDVCIATIIENLS
ncbi:MAG: hypothetical protein J6D03_10585 [Clostridia bacterium]|nr:hypothetical protein [Clostridia bacterium]